MYEYHVKKITAIVDGDTVDVDIDLGFGMIYKKQRVRMMGIDTPESRTSDDVEKLFGLDKLIFLDKAEKTEISVYLRSLEFGVYPNRHIPSDFETITCLLKHFENVTGMKKYFLKYKENYDKQNQNMTEKGLRQQVW